MLKTNKVVQQKKRNKERSKEAIIQAAIVVFAKHGYDKATYKMISDISKLNESLITRYFGSKRGLAIATIAYVKDDCFNLLASLEPRETFSDEFHALGTKLTNVYSKNVNNIVTLFLFIPMEDELIDNSSKDSLLLTPNGERLRKFQENGEIPKDIDLDKLYKRMIMMTHSILYFTFLVLNLPINQAERLLHFNIDAFIYGLTKENKSLNDIKSGFTPADPSSITVDRRREPRES